MTESRMDAQDALSEDLGEGKSSPTVDVKKISIGELVTSSKRLSIGSVMFLFVMLGIVFSAGWKAHPTDGNANSQSDTPLVSDDSLRSTEETLARVDPLFRNEMGDLLIEKEEILSLEVDLIDEYQRLSEEPNTTDYYRTVYSQKVDSLINLFGGLGSVPIEVTLAKGWNLIGYTGRQQISPREAFAGIMQILVVVRSSDGKSFIPQDEVDEIGALVPGEGYNIFVERDTVFAFPTFELPDLD